MSVRVGVEKEFFNAFNQELEIEAEWNVKRGCRISC